MTFDGAIILITGGASGIGLACAQRFTRLGAEVWCLDSDPSAIEAAQAECLDGSPCRFLRCDVGRPDEVASAVDVIYEQSGTIGLLLNNAAILRDQTLVARLGKRVKKHSIDDWTETITANLTGTFLVAREVAARWVAQRTGGLIINTSSVVRPGNPGQSAYAASKAAVESLTVTWSQELAPYGIRVASIAYGFADTPMTCDIPAVFREQIRSKTPIKRFGRIEEFVHAVQFICENEYFVGKVLEIDGGLRF